MTAFTDRRTHIAWSWDEVKEEEISVVCRKNEGHEEYMHSILFRNSEVKRQLCRPRHRCDDNIKINLKEIGCENVEWNQLNHGTDQWWAPLNTVMNFQATSQMEFFLSKLSTVTFPRRPVLELSYSVG
jgi:hypothetical protein